ncbi:TPA: sugar ABC transporter substrate-binding protein, partial [Candidatus Sumerlaeota bacterium]|nr:sugar ABC transporter substrate-binding protein [Candidatus Sumerlaeota bacterium]
CFDEEEDTLQGVQDGLIYGTVVQQPYLFGYEAVRVLSQIARGEDPKIPENKIIDVPVRKINKDNVKEFWSDLKKLRGK